MNIYPSILTGDEQVVEQQLQLSTSFKDCKVVQLDVIDGYFADNLTLSPIDFAQFDFGQLKIDFHLMTEEPLDMVYEIKANRDRLPVRAVIGQVERMTHQDHFLEEVQKEEWVPGLSLDLHTPLQSIDQSSWRLLKLVQLMSIEAGFQGQQFVPSVLEKIEELVALRLDRNLKFEIVVDGGVKIDWLDELKALGADGVSVGSGIWQAASPRAMYKQLSKK